MLFNRWIVLTVWLILFISTPTNGQLTVQSQYGWYDQEVNNFVYSLDPSLYNNNIDTVSGRTQIATDMVQIATDIKGTLRWNVLICGTNQCTWNFPYCQRNYLLLTYYDYYLEIFTCS